MASALCNRLRRKQTPDQHRYNTEDPCVAPAPTGSQEEPGVEVNEHPACDRGNVHRPPLCPCRAKSHRHGGPVDRELLRQDINERMALEELQRRVNHHIIRDIVRCDCGASQARCAKPSSSSNLVFQPVLCSAAPSRESNAATTEKTKNTSRPSGRR